MSPADTDTDCWGPSVVRRIDGTLCSVPCSPDSVNANYSFDDGV